MSSAPIDALCQIITDLSDSPRPPRSAEELRAAQYIQYKLQDLNLTDIEQQPFFAVGKMSERLGAASVLAGAGMLIGAGHDKWRRVTGSLLVLGAALSARQILQGQAPVWEAIYPQRRSQNVLGRIPAAEETKERVVLLAHMDTDLTRLTGQPQLRDYAPYLFAGLPNTALLGSMLTLFNAPLWLRHTLAYILFGEAGMTVANELGKSTTGANDNASGVATLLALGETLAQNPLKNTEVVLAFTGCGTVAGQGAAEIAKTYGNQWQDAYWLALDNIGAGEIGWVSSHGWSSNARYTPHPAMTDLLGKVARQNPHLGIMGRSMTTIDDVAPLRAKGLKAAMLMGYERASGFPRQWQNADDTPAHIDPETLSRTWEFLNKVLKTVDDGGAQD